MTELLGSHAVETGDEQLKAASVDRFKKYTAVHGIYDGPIPAAVVYPSSTAEVAAILRFATENLVNVVPRTGGTATEGKTVVRALAKAAGRGRDVDRVKLVCDPAK